MVDKKVLAWAKKQLARGVSVGDITRAMVKSGYTEPEIDEVLASVFKGKK
ncbi:MAG: hypothetical protein J7L23_03815 [Candidatus Diapherotrites archaeon]|nr:hypothetical protein [Candidatus Diapherotrites archaeon]